MGRIATKRNDSTPESPRYDVIVWGTVSRDANLTFTKSKEIPKVQFGISYDKKTFMNCVALDDKPATRVAADLQKGDAVLCVGVWSSREYTDKNGEKKTWAELVCDLVIKQPDVFYAQSSGEEDNSGEPGTNAAGDDTSEYEDSDYELTI